MILRPAHNNFSGMRPIKFTSAKINFIAHIVKIKSGDLLQLTYLSGKGEFTVRAVFHCTQESIVSITVSVTVYTEHSIRQNMGGCGHAYCLHS